MTAGQVSHVIDTFQRLTDVEQLRALADMIELAQIGQNEISDELRAIADSARKKALALELAEDLCNQKGIPDGLPWSAVTGDLRNRYLAHAERLINLGWKKDDVQK